MNKIKIIKLSILLIFIITDIQAAFIGFNASIIKYDIDSVTLEIFIEYSDGPPERDFLGVRESKISNDTLYVDAIYERTGSFGTFYSYRVDSMRISLPTGINYLHVQPTNRLLIGMNPTVYDSVNEFSDTTLILWPNSVREVIKTFDVDVFPNPTKSNLSILINSSSSNNYVIKLFDIMGRLVDDDIFTGRLLSGEHKINLDLSSKAIGSYFINIMSNNEKKVIPVHRE